MIPHVCNFVNVFICVVLKPYDDHRLDLALSPAFLFTATSPVACAHWQTAPALNLARVSVPFSPAYVP